MQRKNRDRQTISAQTCDMVMISESVRELSTLSVMYYADHWRVLSLLMWRLWRFWSAITALCALALWPSLAAADAIDAAATRQVFLPADFDRFAPRTALDMVRQIAGFSVREGGGDRGLGQADTNVLINGRRISGKSNGPVEALGRITVGDVERLELIDGASLDIAGLSGQVLNVVTRTAGGVSGRFRYSPQFRNEGTPFQWGDGEISASGGGAQSEWTLSLVNDQQRRGGSGPEFVFDGDGALIDFRQERNNQNIDTPSLSGSYTRTADNGNVLNLTGALQGFIRRRTEISDRNPVAGGAGRRRLRQTEDEYNFELGGDYDFAAPGGRLKLIGLYRYENSPTVAGVRFDFLDGSPPQGSVFTQQANEAELIVRSEYTINALGGAWQFSTEAARNFLDIEASLEERNASGVLEPVAFLGSSSRVEEKRAEAMVSYSRALTPRLQLQTSFGAEYSELNQSGEFGLMRDFIRPKGLVSLDWDANPALNISTRLERVVGQLNFFDFIATVNVNQGRVNVSNANLAPPQSWLLEVEANQLLGEYGSVTLRGFAEDITDIVDQIPIEGGGQAPGNIDAAMQYGAAMNLTLLSDPTGWKGGRLDLDLTFTDSEVIDPLLGLPRRISDRDYLEMELDVRQDIQNTDWAIGSFIFYGEETPMIRLDEVSIDKRRFAFMEVYVENKDVFGLTVRGVVGNVLNRDDDFVRNIFNDRLTNDVAFREERFRNFGVIFTLDIEGSF